MACTTATSLKEVRPQPLQTTAKQVSIDNMDPMDPLNWNADDLDLLGKVVEMEGDEISHIVNGNNSNSRKRAREDEMVPPLEERKHQDHMLRQQQGEITTLPSSVSIQDHEDIKLCDDLMIATDDRPRVSRRRKKKPNSFPKRPFGPYGIFYHRERQRIVESMNEGSLSEDDIQRQVGKIWRTLPDDEIKKYEEQAEADKARYHAEMAAYEEGKSFSKKNQNGLDEDSFHELPPPPPGVTLISATDNGSVATAAGVKDGRNSVSPVPHTPPRWVFGPSALNRTRSYPAPKPTRSVPQPQAVQSRSYSYGAVPPSPRSWASPPSPYQPARQGSYSPHFGHPARPASTYIPPPPREPGYSIPPGMELALPTPTGGERKYKVTYQCYKMRSEDVQGFLDSMSARIMHPPPQQHSHAPHPHQHPHSPLPAHHHPSQALPPPPPSYGHGHPPPPRW